MKLKLPFPVSNRYYGAYRVDTNGVNEVSMMLRDVAFSYFRARRVAGYPDNFTSIWQFYQEQVKGGYGNNIGDTDYRAVLKLSYPAVSGLGYSYRIPDFEHVLFYAFHTHQFAQDYYVTRRTDPFKETNLIIRFPNYYSVLGVDVWNPVVVYRRHIPEEVATYLARLIILDVYEEIVLATASYKD